MIVVPGPIHSAKWIRSTEHAKLLDLVSGRVSATAHADGRWPFQGATPRGRSSLTGRVGTRGSCGWLTRRMKARRRGAAFRACMDTTRSKVRSQGRRSTLASPIRNRGWANQHPVYHRESVLWRWPSALYRQRRVLAVAGDRHDLLRGALHEVDPAREPRAAVARLVARGVVGRSRSLRAGRHGRVTRTAVERAARTADAGYSRRAGDAARQYG